MQNRLRVIVLLFSLDVVGGCGFHAVYGAHNDSDGSPVAAQLNQITIDNIPDRNGQMLRNDLIDAMYGKGRPAQPQYELAIKLHNTQEDLGILENAVSTRTLMNMYGDYTLKDMKGKVILAGNAHSVTSFNKLNDQYGTLAAQEDAYQRTVNEVSQQIVNRLSLFFAEGPLPAPVPEAPK